MSENISFHPDVPQEGGVEAEKSREIRDQLFGAYEGAIKCQYNQDNPPRPEEERKMEEIKDSEGRVLAHFDKIRDPHTNYTGRENSWLIMDFDDVINLTSEYMRRIGADISNRLGITEERFKELYDQAKKKNEFGKNVFHVNELIKKLKELYPDNSQDVDDVFENQNYEDFVDQGVLRALLSLRDSHNFIRISILTFGDLEYQKKRLEGAGVTELMDDVIYTEGSKKDVVAEMVKRQYPAGTYEDNQTHEQVDLPMPNIITVDDSPSHIDDYADLPFAEKYRV